MGIVFSTAGAIVQDAYEELGLFRANEPLDALEMATGLRRLNLLLDEMSIDRSLIYSRTEDGPLVTVAGTRSYTIGTSQTWNTAKPIKIEQAFIKIDNVDYPIDPTMTDREYQAIATKTEQAQPTRLFFKQGTTSGTVYFDYTPDAVYSVYLFSHKPFTKFASQSDSVAWPDGFEAALMLNLAVRLGPRYGKDPMPATVALASKLAGQLAALYGEKRYADFSGVPSARRGGTFDITTGE